MSKKPYYITTPIYYPSGNLHLGHTYTTIVADTLKKFKQIQGHDAYLVTGTDEHGQKLLQSAQAAGMETMEYIDGIVKDAKALWKTLEIDYDDFVRSTEARHEANVQAIFQKLYDSGDIYKSVYEGYYCTPCESFWTDSQLEEGKCPDCGREVHHHKEESYFFRLSKYQDQLLDYFAAHPDFVQPESARNEMLAFIKQGLEDLSVSRTSFDWGIKVPFDDNHIIYVWIDALFCYWTGIGFGQDDDKFNHFWPASVHLMSKEILRFHAIIWPALHMALGAPLPQKVFAHGWILFGDDKMSKSKGNVVYAEPLIELYGIDALKYFVLREFTFGQDGSFTTEKFLRRTNSDLANDLGNLVSRTVAMVEKYRDGLVPQAKGDQGVDADLKATVTQTAETVENLIDKLNFSHALEEIWKTIRRTNKYIDETEPWVLAKDSDSERLDTVLYNLCEAIRAIGQLVQPFMGKTTDKIFAQLGTLDQGWESSKTFGLLEARTKVEKGPALFPRLDVEKELDRWLAANDAFIESRSAKTGVVQAAEEVEASPAKPEISFEDFSKLELKVGKILACEAHPNADKLLVLTVDLGTEERTIVSGIKNWYDSEDLVGKSVVVCTNLAPRKMRGIESQGMVLAATEGSGLSLLTTLEDMPAGSDIS